MFLRQRAELHRPGILLNLLHGAKARDGNGLRGASPIPGQSSLRHRPTLAGEDFQDGINWQLEDEPIQWQTDDPEIGHFQYRYDQRVVWFEDRYYVTWCNGYHGPTIGIGYTFDFEKFTFLENALLPFNRNGVLFPRKINGEYVMLSRPSDNGHTPFGDIYLSRSPDLIHWGKHRFVMGVKDGWQSTKIGAGPVPIETSEGWLMIYHGVLTSCNGFV